MVIETPPMTPPTPPPDLDDDLTLWIPRAKEEPAAAPPPEPPRFPASPTASIKLIESIRNQGSSSRRKQRSVRHPKSVRLEKEPIVSKLPPESKKHSRSRQRSLPRILTDVGYQPEVVDLKSATVSVTGSSDLQSHTVSTRSANGQAAAETQRKGSSSDRKRWWNMGKKKTIRRKADP